MKTQLGEKSLIQKNSFVNRLVVYIWHIIKHAKNPNSGRDLQLILNHFKLVVDVGFF